MLQNSSNQTNIIFENNIYPQFQSQKFFENQGTLNLSQGASQSQTFQKFESQDPLLLEVVRENLKIFEKHGMILTQSESYQLMSFFEQLIKSKRTLSKDLGQPTQSNLLLKNLMQSPCFIPGDQKKFEKNREDPELKCVGPNSISEFDHLLMIDGENLRQGAEKSRILFNDTQNSKILI